MLLRALDPLVDYHQIDHALVNFGVNMSTTAEDENYTLVRHESCSSSPEFSIPVSLFFLAHQILQVEKNYGEKKLHSIKLVLKALKFKCGEAGMVRECY